MTPHDWHNLFTGMLNGALWLGAFGFAVAAIVTAILNSQPLEPEHPAPAGPTVTPGVVGPTDLGQQ